MKSYIFIFWLITTKVYGQELLEVKYYLDNKKIPKLAKDFYNGKVKPADDTNTFSIIDSLNTKNHQTRPFYILVVSKMLDKADGALSESLGVSCKKFIESNPDFLIAFLYSKNSVVTSNFIDNWANEIAGDFMIGCEGKEKSCIEKSERQSLANTKSSNKIRLTKLYKKIKSSWQL